MTWFLSQNSYKKKKKIELLTPKIEKKNFVLKETHIFKAFLTHSIDREK